MDDTLTDPVCGMTLKPGDVVERQVYRGRSYYFCSIGCAGKFGRAPHLYVGDVPPEPDAAPAVSPGSTAPVRDPVCGMDVDPHQNELEFEGAHYAFCSVQCRERFVANPHLYIGVPGEKAPAQQGVEVIKRRRFRLDEPLTATQAAGLVEALGALMGIRDTDVTGNTITITYDLLQVTAEQIEARMAEIGMNMGNGWAERLQRGFVHYLEECELGNLEVTPHRGHH